MQLNSETGVQPFGGGKVVSKPNAVERPEAELSAAKMKFRERSGMQATRRNSVSAGCVPGGCSPVSETL